jgi:hypothetical protein
MSTLIETPEDRQTEGFANAAPHEAKDIEQSDHSINPGGEWTSIATNPPESIAPELRQRNNESIDNLYFICISNSIREPHALPSGLAE